VNNDIVAFEYILHEENLYENPSWLSTCEECHYQSCNFIWSNGLNHRQIQNLLSELVAECCDLVSYSEVGCVNCIKMLKHIFSLGEEVQVSWNQNTSLFMSFSIHSRCVTLDSSSTLLGICLSLIVILNVKTNSFTHTLWLHQRFSGKTGPIRTPTES
jgi:hypothetical protein